MDYDVFICHASEDKEKFVEPLANALKDAGLRVWYDRFEFKLGDSLRGKIDEGLANSEYGTVVLSKPFFKKKWPQNELDALLIRQNAEGKKVIIPIWHEIEADEVAKFSPILSGKFAARSSDPLNVVVSQILDVCNEERSVKPVSVFQTSGRVGLRERCLEIIRQNDLGAWHEIVQEVSSTIPEKLEQWKPQGEAALTKCRQDHGKAWEESLLNAANLCLPAFVPIFASIESHKEDFWKESLRVLRQLSILEDSMGGGLVEACSIGSKMLCVAGSLGMALAVQKHRLDFVDNWMSLPMPLPGRSGEQPWHSIFAVLRLPGVMSPEDPLRFLLTICDSDDIQGFFPGRASLMESLFLANLLQSLIELRNCINNQHCCKALVEGKASGVTPYVYPVWLLIGSPQKFRSLTLGLFGSSTDVMDFVFPNHDMSAEQFWPLWRHWRKVCAHYFVTGRSVLPYLQHEFFRLPGEPDPG